MPITERSYSGLVRALGKRVDLYRSRGFESLPLRQLGNEVIGSPRCSGVHEPF